MLFVSTSLILRKHFYLLVFDRSSKISEATTGTYVKQNNIAPIKCKAKR